jgi:YjjG family noncanonical pyrimidine nucleotidase
MIYETILFDLDHTLFDSHESERQAYAHATSRAGLAQPAAHFDRYVAINREMWAAVERGDMQPTEVRHRRFEHFIEEIGLVADIHRMAEDFVWGLGSCGDLYPGADQLLAQLAGRASLGLVTNGLSEVQRSRLSRLGITDYFDAIVISSEVGVTKPRSDIFEIAFEQLGNPDKESAVMVGDSLTSDIAGGRNFGIDTCWYNPAGVMAGEGDVPTHEVASLADLTRALSGDRR